jgi:hypothetical protein
MKLSKTLVNQILADCEQALAAVAERHGLELVRKSCRYTELEMPVAFKLKAQVTNDAGTVVTQEARDFERYASGYGLDGGDLGRAFSSRGKRYEVTGLAMRSRKYPVLARCSNTGRTYKFTADLVKRALEAS